MSKCQVCPRCGMHYLNGVAHPSFASKPVSDEWVAQKVCQFAQQQDNHGKDYPVGCINPSYNKFQDYGPFDNDSDLKQSLSRVFNDESI